jgi:hypothetical protein
MATRLQELRQVPIKVELTGMTYVANGARERRHGNNGRVATLQEMIAAYETDQYLFSRHDEAFVLVPTQAIPKESGEHRFDPVTGHLDTLHSSGVVIMVDISGRQSGEDMTLSILGLAGGRLHLRIGCRQEDMAAIAVVHRELDSLAPGVTLDEIRKLRAEAITDAMDALANVPRSMENAVKERNDLAMLILQLVRHSDGIE